MALRRVAEDPKMLTLAMHRQMAFRPREGSTMRLIKYAKSFPDVWSAKRIEIVNWAKEDCLQKPIFNLLLVGDCVAMSSWRRSEDLSYKGTYR